jgi:plasmid rolling circle replication initiator protein Rep
VDLRTTLKEMAKAWQQMLNLRNFPKVKGWIRSTEVTMGNEGAEFCHPHFHCLFLVPPSYFSKGYKTHADLMSLWRSSARLDYDPTVNVYRFQFKKSEKRGIGIRLQGKSPRSDMIILIPEK